MWTVHPSVWWLHSIDMAAIHKSSLAYTLIALMIMAFSEYHHNYIYRKMWYDFKLTIKWYFKCQGGGDSNHGHRRQLIWLIGRSGFALIAL